MHFEILPLPNETKTSSSCDSNLQIAIKYSVPILVCATEKFDRAAQAWMKESEVNEEWMSEHLKPRQTAEEFMAEKRGLEGNPKNAEVIKFIESFEERCKQCKECGPFDELVKVMCLENDYIDDPLLKQQLTWENNFHKNANDDWHWTTILDMLEKSELLKSEVAAHLDEKFPSQRCHFFSCQYLRGWIMTHLVDFKNIMKSLKRMSVGLTEGREIFDLVLTDEAAEHGTMIDCLHDDAPFCSDYFESACIKIIEERFYAMTSKEKAMAKYLLIGNSEPPKILAGEKIYLALTRKRKYDYYDLWDKKRCHEGSIAYHNPKERIRFTSACCERLFTKDDVVDFPYTRFVSPIMLEHLVFLKSNRSLWDECSVSKAMEEKNPDYEYHSENRYKRADKNWYYDRESEGGKYLFDDSDGDDMIRSK